MASSLIGDDQCSSTAELAEFGRLRWWIEAADVAAEARMEDEIVAGGPTKENVGGTHRRWIAVARVEDEVVVAAQPYGDHLRLEPAAVFRLKSLGCLPICGDSPLKRRRVHPISDRLIDLRK